ncbi:transposable element Tc1 transposase [Trichonephila clavipes]|nr:transposable element Tc1 transposase [Trichonephila clavipes]
MPLRRNRRQYEQLTDLDRGRIIGLREAGWSNRRIGRPSVGAILQLLGVGNSGSQKVECTVAEGSVDWIRATWSVTDWRRVIFSDESRFSLSADDHRTRVWRRTGQRSDPAFIVERHTAISQGVTVWGDDQVVLQGILTARRYVDDILTPIVLPNQVAQVPFINRIMLVHILRDSPNNVFNEWPARSPDLSPIEHVWTRWEGNCSRPEIQEN